MGVVLLLIETTYCLNLQAFKTHNGAWPRTEVVMTDKDMAERSVFSAAFPSASLQLCLFHTLRSFSREVTLQKMGIRVGQRDALLAIFNAMAVARSEQAFEDQCAALEAMNIAAVSTYFRRNWMPIKLEWVQCFKSRCFTLGETTNNRLESLNGKIKSVCSRFASLHDFFEDFFSLLRVLRGETEHSAIIHRISTTSRRVANLTTDDRQYSTLLTPYAYNLVLSQIALRDAANVSVDGTPVLSTEGPLFVTSSSCECAFRASYRLPCRHILARRKVDGQTSYDESLVDRRWTVGYSFGALTATTVRVSEVPTTTSGAVLSSHQKYKQAMAVAADLASLASEVGMREFRGRLAALKELRSAWSERVSFVTALLEHA